MCHPLLGAVVQLKKHRVCDVKTGELVQCTGRHNDFATVVHILSFRTREHSDGIAAVVFIEATSGTTRAHHAAAEYAFHRVVEVIGSELELLIQAHEADRSEQSGKETHHGGASGKATLVKEKKLKVEERYVGE